MSDIAASFIQVLLALGQFGVAVLAVLVPWTPLAAWLAYWLFGVNWVKLTEVLLRGGWIGLVLLGLVAVLAWGVVAPPEGGVHHLLGLQVGNFVGKFVYVTALIVMMLLCGSVQLAGFCGSWARFPEPAADEHGDGGHGSHSHDDPHLTVHAH